ncbi:MAG TPA: hypothetical protein IAA32_08855, partial [Candidatus Butyricicoccus stercorigallinarum]|nr:hypothetical protein [Candidatus Butyricicoccus stercorigallinarum]
LQGILGDQFFWQFIVKITCLHRLFFGASTARPPPYPLAAACHPARNDMALIISQSADEIKCGKIRCFVRFLQQSGLTKFFAA